MLKIFFALTLLAIFASSTAQQLPVDCAEAAQFSGVSGIYQIQPKNISKPFFVYCEKATDGEGAWTIIQRRQDGKVDFYRDWNDYKRGFGNIFGEYWIGLDNLRAMTNAAVQELWIQLEDYNNSKAFINYDAFAIGDERQGYILNVLGKSRGNAGDSLRFHKGMQFSTVDRQNCPGRHWARLYTGAWWFHNDGFQCDLNGKYRWDRTNNIENMKGITWSTFRPLEVTLKYAHMAIRTRKYPW